MYEIRVDGQSILAPWIHRWRYYRGGFENRLDGVVLRYGLTDLHPYSKDDWVVDVGAYMGELSVQMLRRGFNVLAIEPDPDAARCLRENLKRHDPRGNEWRIDTRVCCSEQGQVTFHLEPHGADSSMFPSIARPSFPVTLVAACLDDIVEEQIGSSPIRGLKIDAEGAEPEVLRGARKLLERVPRISIDAGYERRGESTVDECQHILYQAGFNILSGDEISRDIVAGWRSTTDSR